MSDHAYSVRLRWMHIQIQSALSATLLHCLKRDGQRQLAQSLSDRILIVIRLGFSQHTIPFLQLHFWSTEGLVSSLACGVHSRTSLQPTFKNGVETWHSRGLKDFSSSFYNFRVCSWVIRVVTENRPDRFILPTRSCISRRILLIGYGYYSRAEG